MNEEMMVPATFLGMAEHIETHSDKQPFPITPIDIYQLSCHKFHIIFPAILNQNAWLIALNTKLLDKLDEKKELKFRIVDKNERALASTTLSITKEEVNTETDSNRLDNFDSFETIVPAEDDFSFILIHFNIDAVIYRPEMHTVQMFYKNNYAKIGTIFFHYNPIPPLKPDQIKALESNPNSVKAVGVEYKCNSCNQKMLAYASLTKQPQLEQKGFVWQYDLKEDFKCKCNETSFSLKYLKESMHGLLLKVSAEQQGLSYIRRYAHAQIVTMVDEFNDLIATEKNEEPIQKYIENHPVLLARFHASRLFPKPKILDQFVADFAILDTRNQLFFIEIEKPSIQLFKKRDGHATAQLIHAFDQVNDWLHEFNKHRHAILGGLGLNPENIMAVKGVVIAGRTPKDSIKPLQRFLSRPPYPEIDFLTFDDLSSSLLQISLRLA